MSTQIRNAVLGVLSLVASSTGYALAQSLIPADVQIHGHALQTFPFGSNAPIESPSDSNPRPSLPVASPVTIVAPMAILAIEGAEIAANPGRPAMATSALLTPLGHAQFENGMLFASGSAQFSKRASMEETMRFTVAPRLQFIFSSEPVAYSRMAQNDLTQRGDATAGVQVVAMKGQGAAPTISLSYLRLVHGGNATDLDIGGYANSVLLMASLDLGRFHFDSNGFINEIEGPERRAQFGEATAMTLPVRPKLTATLELRGFTEPLAKGPGFSTLVAAGYSPRPNLVFDAGVVRGLTSTSTRWQATGGFSYVLPRHAWGL